MSAANPHPAGRRPATGNRTDLLGRLIPLPRRIDINGPPVEANSISISAGPGCEAAVEALAELEDSLPGPAGTGRTLRVTVSTDADEPAGEPDASGVEGYLLSIEEGTGGPTADLVGTDAAGTLHAAHTLRQLVTVTRTGLVAPAVRIADRPEMAWRGVIEGFYGAPWSAADRISMLDFCAAHKMNTFVYAPKDDPFHRERWREPYPEDQLMALADLAARARDRHIEFVFALSPGMSMCYSDPQECELLAAKAAQVHDAGVRRFALFFDDITPALSHHADRATYGTDAGGPARAHAATCADFVSRLGPAVFADLPLLMVPTDYAGTAHSDYRTALAENLPADILVYWTGADVVVGGVSREEIDAAAVSYGHRLLLWDNFPVNDFDPFRLFLGPLIGRTQNPPDVGLVGVTANPMVQAAASVIPLATVADWAWNPAGYDPGRALDRALTAAAGIDAPALRPLVEACSAWPPSAPRSPEIAELIETILIETISIGTISAGRPGAAAVRLREILHAHVAAPQLLTGANPRLVQDLQPWLEAASTAATAALAALDLTDDDTPEKRARAITALHAARASRHDVLKDLLTGFADRLLDHPADPPA